MKWFALWVTALLAAFAPWVAQATGKAIYEARCQACHQSGAEGSEAMKAPALSGLSGHYLSLQIRHFRDGIRGADKADSEGQIMASMAAGLSDEDVNELADYLANLPPVFAPAPPAPMGFAARGQYSSCSSCHGAGGEGVESLGAPRLAGQHSWYLKAQLQKFRQGIRGNHPGDVNGAQMRTMAVAIPDEATVETLVRYIGQQGR